MIFLYSGTPGSCKSMHQAELIYDLLSQGQCVLANYNIKTNLIPHYKGTFYQYDIFSLKPAYLKQFSRSWFKDHKFHEGSLNLFIDEAQLIFNSREWGRSDRQEWLEFFTQHRKYGYDVFMISQSDKMLDKQIRALIEYETIHRKLSSGGLWSKIFSVLFGGGTYVCVKVWYPMKMQIGKSFHHVRAKYYRLYDSYMDFAETSEPQPEVSGSSTESARLTKGGEPLALNGSEVLHCSPVSQASQVFSFKQLKNQVSVRHSIAGEAAVSQAAEQGAGEDGNGVDFATGQEQKHPVASAKRKGVQA